MLTLKVINMFAGPGAGKSTTAAGLFNLMKSQGMSVELVTEYAKDLTYEDALNVRANQLHLLGVQDQRLRRLEGHVEYAITDSPLPIGIAYLPPEYEEWLTPTIWAAFNRYENYNVLVQRSDAHPYQTYGRTQSLAEAMKLDNIIDNIYDTATYGDEDFALEVLGGTPEAPYQILEWVLDGEEVGDE